MLLNREFTSSRYFVFFRIFIMKILFPVALSTAKSVGEIRALSARVAFHASSYILLYLPEFIAKMESSDNPVP